MGVVLNKIRNVIVLNESPWVKYAHRKCIIFSCSHHVSIQLDMHRASDLWKGHVKLVNKLVNQRDFFPIPHTVMPKQSHNLVPRVSHLPTWGDERPWERGWQSQTTHLCYLQSNCAFEFFVEYCQEYLGYLQCTSARKQKKERLSFQRSCGVASIVMHNVKMIGGKGVYKSAITTVRRSQTWHLEPVTPSHCSSQEIKERPLIVLDTFSCF